MYYVRILALKLGDNLISYGDGQYKTSGSVYLPVGWADWLPGLSLGDISPILLVADRPEFGY